jgi:hypothetical protein
MHATSIQDLFPNEAFEPGREVSVIEMAGKVSKTIPFRLSRGTQDSKSAQRAQFVCCPFLAMLSMA